MKIVYHIKLIKFKKVQIFMKNSNMNKRKKTTNNKMMKKDQNKFTIKKKNLNS